MTLTPTHRLNDGTVLPAIGLGTFGLNDSPGADAVATAIGLGYRLLDTAYGYGNEDAVGDGIRRSGLDRDELVVTSKVPDEHHGAARTRESLSRTLESLGLDRVDLYLIHWPRPDQNLYVETWEAMVELQAIGLIRTIGVCNFDAAQLDRISAATGVVPAVNQVKINPVHQQSQLRQANAERGILTEAYTPLRPAEQIQSSRVLAEIADAHDVTINQVTLRWIVQHGAVPIPMSRRAAHQRENLAALDFELSGVDVKRIDDMAVDPA
jgi:diketogulonate reductase-like aldo/keto reductase